LFPPDDQFSLTSTGTFFFLFFLGAVLRCSFFLQRFSDGFCNFFRSSFCLFLQRFLVFSLLSITFCADCEYLGAIETSFLRELSASPPQQPFPQMRLLFPHPPPPLSRTFFLHKFIPFFSLSPFSPTRTSHPRIFFLLTL